MKIWIIKVINVSKIAIKKATATKDKIILSVEIKFWSKINAIIVLIYNLNVHWYLSIV